jgi:hypothetical protein
MNWQILKTKLDTDEYKNLSNEQAALALSQETFTRSCECSIGNLNALADSRGVSVTLHILDRKTDDQLTQIYGSNAETARGLIIAALSLFNARYESVDFTIAENYNKFIQVVNGLQQFQIITAEDASAFIALGTETVKWIVVNLGINEIGVGDIAFARNPFENGSVEAQNWTP